MAFNTRRGIRPGPDELPSWLKVSFDAWSLQPDTLLGEVLRDFDLRREPPDPGQPGTTVAIRATPKSGHTHPELRGARLEFDAEIEGGPQARAGADADGPAVRDGHVHADRHADGDDRLFELEGHSRHRTRSTPAKRAASVAGYWRCGGSRRRSGISAAADDAAVADSSKPVKDRAIPPSPEPPTAPHAEERTNPMNAINVIPRTLAMLTTLQWSPRRPSGDPLRARRSTRRR